MHLKFLTRYVKHLTSQEVGGRGTFAGCILEECNLVTVVVFCKKVTSVVGKITFSNGNEWPCDSDSDSTFHRWLQLSSCVCLNSIPTKYCLYLLKLISIFGHFLTVNNRRYGRCYVKFIIPLCTFLEFYTQVEANSAKSFQNAFCVVPGL